MHQRASISQTTSAAITAEDGSSLLEVLVALGILMVGAMGLAQVFILGMIQASTSQANLVAREKAREAVESVHTARDTGTITWAEVRNVGEGGIFIDGPQPLYEPGADGIVSTLDDDDIPKLETVSPGADGLLGTSDDVKAADFTREIVIEDVPGDPNLRQVTVTVGYRVGAVRPQPFRLVTFVSAFS